MATKSETPKKKPATRKPKAAPAPKPEAAPEVTWQGRLGQEMAALLLLGLAGFFLLALWSYTRVDSPGAQGPVGRRGGPQHRRQGRGPGGRITSSGCWVWPPIGRP